MLLGDRDDRTLERATMLERLGNMTLDDLKLHQATQRMDDDDFLTTIRLDFGEQSLVLNALVDDSTIDVTFAKSKSTKGEEECPALSSALGKRLSYAWLLENHQGYGDALQLEFSDHEGERDIVQFLVLSAEIEVWRLTLC